MCMRACSSQNWVPWNWRSYRCSWTWCEPWEPNSGLPQNCALNHWATLQVHVILVLDIQNFTLIDFHGNSLHIAVHACRYTQFMVHVNRRQVRWQPWCWVSLLVPALPASLTDSWVPRMSPIFTSHLSTEALGLEMCVPCVCLLIWVLGIRTQVLMLAHSKHLTH